MEFKYLYPKKVWLILELPYNGQHDISHMPWCTIPYDGVLPVNTYNASAISVEEVPIDKVERCEISIRENWRECLQD